jgi:hypothetical protein
VTRPDPDTSRAIVTREDVETAQSVLDAWLVDHIAPQGATEGFILQLHGITPYLRGLVTQALADAHARGFEQGCDRGRRMIGNRLRDLLEDEGC